MLLPADAPVPADQSATLAAQFLVHVGAVDAIDGDVIEEQYRSAAETREEEAWRAFDDKAARINDTLACAVDREELDELRLQTTGRTATAAERRTMQQIEARLNKADERVEALRQKVAAKLADHRAFVVRWVNQQLAAEERRPRR